MEIFFGNLPQTTTAHDLHVLLNEYDWEARVNVFEKRAPQGRVIVYGVARIEADNIARLAIANLQNSKVKGEAITVREFVRRRQEDRRGGETQRAWKDLERRKTERRVVI